MDLLRNARSGVERLSNVSAAVSVTAAANTNSEPKRPGGGSGALVVADRRIPPTGPLAALCQQLHHELCCKEEIIQLQGHAFARQLRLVHSRSEAEITRRCYALLFEVDELRRTNKSLVADRMKLHEQAAKDARRMYRNQVRYSLLFSFMLGVSFWG